MPMPETPCPFCSPDPIRVFFESAHHGEVAAVGSGSGPYLEDCSGRRLS